MSSIVTYFKENPDPQYAGCRNTGALEDGVEFPGFEPMLGHVGFIGRTSIVEAVGELYGLTPDEVRAALEKGTPRQRAALDKLNAKIALLEADKVSLFERIEHALRPPASTGLTDNVEIL